MGNTKVYEIITEKFIESLERGEIPWQKPWNGAGQLPANGKTGRTYSGVNILLLAMQPYEQPYWVTYNQAKKLGGNVKKGESSTPITYWNFYHKDRESGENLSDAAVENMDRDQYKTIGFLKYYNVFNIDQCENLDPEKVKKLDVPTFDWDPDQKAESIFNNMPKKPNFQHSNSGAWYRKKDDLLNMPDRERFPDRAKYYGALFHEMIHSTGHKSRLDRDLKSYQGDKTSYSKEELTAEIGSAFLCNEAGYLEPEFDNSAAYINGWLKKLKNKDNVKMIVHAASKAQKAAQYITDNQ